MKQVNWKFWRGGETNTWAWRGGYIGASLGFIVGLIVALYQWINRDVAIPGTDSIVTATMSTPVLFLIPFIGLFLGAFAGVLVGIGTPKFKPRPEQGGWAYAKRNKRDLKKLP
jgi:hypothetical protein